MTRRIKQRKSEVITFANVITRETATKGKWNTAFFKNDNPIILELGCGKGEYTLSLAQLYPHKNFIGVDIRGARLWRGAKTAMELNLTNVFFLNIFIQQITDYFAPGEASEIWITFPDPYPKKRHTKHRLTAPNFLKLYRQIIKKGGLIHLKTDEKNLFDYTVEVLEAEHATIHEVVEDLHNSHNNTNEILFIKTTYETKYLAAGKPIYYLCFSL